MARGALIKPDKAKAIVADYLVSKNMLSTAVKMGISPATVLKYVNRAEKAGEIEKGSVPRRPRDSSAVKISYDTKPRAPYVTKWEDSGFIKPLTPNQMMGRR